MTKNQRSKEFQSKQFMADANKKLTRQEFYEFQRMMNKILIETKTKNPESIERLK